MPEQGISFLKKIWWAGLVTRDHPCPAARMIRIPAGASLYDKEHTIMPELKEISIEKEIDARGSFCPGPLMELIRGMKALPVGGTLAVLSSDPGSAKDIPAWIQKARHEYLGAFPEQGYTRFVARKAH
jgi:tRNA 2-thiouridine synthesizing protein A